MVSHRLLLLAMSLLAPCACTVGPDYSGPAAFTAPARFARADLTGAETGKLRAQWWLSLHDAQLNRLIGAALAASPDIAKAQARLRQSRAGLREQRANQLPSTDANAVYLHAHTGSDTLGQFGGGNTQAGRAADLDFDFYNIGFDASWEIDLFGGKRRAVESATADVAARQADLASTQLSLTADVAQAYIALRDVQRRAGLAQSSADLQQRMLDLTRMREAGGTASALDVARLTTLLEQTRADLVPLQMQADLQLNRLAVLTGQAPGALDAALRPPAPVPVPPATLAVADPAALLRRRPDIRAAERRIASETALIGVRTADYFPKLTLLGDLGFGSADVGQLLSGGSLTALAAPVLQWNPFDFGRTGARVAQARANRDEAAAEYRGTVLNALEDAENALARYGRQRQEVATLARVKASADRAATLTRQRYEGGTATLIDVLDTERQRLSSEQSLAQASAELTTDFVGLQKSLGLGWTDLPQS